MEGGPPSGPPFGKEESCCIADGFPDTAMPAWSSTLDDDAIQRLAIYVAEQRAALQYTDFKVAAPPPDSRRRPITSEAEAFRVENFSESLHPLPYSIAPLPDRRILVTEKTQGLRIVAPDGVISALIRGTPEVFDDGTVEQRRLGPVARIPRRIDEALRLREVARRDRLACVFASL